MVSGIYAILNFVTNKIYVGSAVKLRYRWKNHRIGLYCNKHTNRYLQSAYKHILAMTEGRRKAKHRREKDLLWAW